MDKLIQKYCNKLYNQGLVEKNAMVLGARDDEIIWNKKDASIENLEVIFNSLNINALLFAMPCEPYRTIIDFLTKTNEDAIYPQDCETRTFIHDLPIIKNFDTKEIVKTLSGRKSVIIQGHGVITFGTVSPEQAFVVFSSVCFASFVKFFSDYLKNHSKNCLTQLEKETLVKVKKMIAPYSDKLPNLIKEVTTEEKIYQSICEAGKMIVDSKLVDSFFGNVSFFEEQSNTLFISQTGSSLDELEGCIDPCPLDNSSCNGITASSEFSTHKEIILNSDTRVILHGHPKFSVILSMNCDKDDCNFKEQCHIKCPEKRYIKDIPIVPGEVGTGRFGIVKTVPKALKENKRCVIVYGHGVFTASCSNNFQEAFEDLLNIERHCFEEYFRKIDLSK